MNTITPIFYMKNELERIGPCHSTMQSNISKIVGDSCYLMCRSELHRQWYISDLVTHVINPIFKNQIFYYYHENKVVAMVTWALLSDDLLKSLNNNENIQLDFSEWQSGNNLWFHDFISDKTFTKLVIKDIKIFFSTLGYRKAYSIRRNSKREIYKNNQWKSSVFKIETIN